MQWEKRFGGKVSLSKSLSFCLSGEGLANPVGYESGESLGTAWVWSETKLGYSLSLEGN